jgi:hypothetical protein
MNKETIKPVYKFERNTWKENPFKVVLAIIIIIVTYIFLYYFGNSFFAMLGIVLPFISFTEIFFPMKYYLFADYLVVDKYFFKVKKEYTYYKKVYKDKNGVFLSPYRFATRMENFRGMLLRVPVAARAEVFTFLEKKISELIEARKEALEKQVTSNK